MPRLKYTTSLESELIDKLRLQYAIEKRAANEIIEQALKNYFDKYAKEKDAN